MDSSRIDEMSEQITVEAKNVGGIEEATVTLSPDVNILAGRNATNRTSFLRAVMAALGSDNVSLRTEAETGYARLSIGDETYERTLEQRGGSTVTDGEPYLDDPRLADLFAFLLESNEARRAVEHGQDLRDLIMRPVDTDQINDEIERCLAQRREIDDKLTTLEDLESELSELVERRQTLESKLEDKRDERARITTEIERAEVSVDSASDDQSRLESKLEELQSTRQELEETRQRIETEQQSIDALQTEREEITDELAELSPTDFEKTEQLEDEITRLQDQKEALGSELSELQNIIEFNEGQLAEASGRTAGGDVTDQLLEDTSTVSCWTCGSTVEREQIKTTIEQLRSRRQRLLDERSTVTEQLKETRDILNSIDRAEQEQQRLEQRRDEIESEIDSRRDRIDTATAQRDQLEDTIETLEASVEQLETEPNERILELHSEASQLEFELEQLETERSDVIERIDSIESKLEQRSDLERRREDLSKTLTELRTRIERLESNAVESFNSHMEEILDVLAYDNIDRIWLDRRQKTVRDGRSSVEKSHFDLKIVRTSDDGVAYEDDIETLSESEREVTGLVFALAGYLTHEVYETVPLMLLDSLEAIDSNRISALIEYFHEFAPSLVVALLYEDAKAVTIDSKTIDDI